MENKIDRLFHDLFRFLTEYISPDPNLRAALTSTITQASSSGDPPETAQEYESFSKERSPGEKVFAIDVDSKGEFTYQPKEWNYAIGNTVRFVSKSGKFSIHVPYQKELQSPFSNERVIRSNPEPDSDGVWKSKRTKITPVFSPAERVARQLTGARVAHFGYVIAVQRKDGEQQLFIDTTQQGSGC